MPKYTLTYFDMDAGRGEPIRIAFHSAGIPFEDRRVSFQEFMQTRDDFLFRCVPVLTIDDQKLTQSNAIGRYVGALADLYPKDPLQALYCDEVTGALEDIKHHMGRSFGLQGDALAQARKELTEGWLTTFIKGIDTLLARGKDGYFADGRLTMADLQAFVWVRSLRSGILDHVPKSLVDDLAPALAEHAERIAKEPKVVAYYERSSS